MWNRAENQMILLLLKSHMIAFFLGFALDMILGDPYCLPHPIRWIGKGIDVLERKLLREGSKRNRQRELRMGRILAAAVMGVTALLTAIVLYTAYAWRIGLGILVESILTYWALAAKCLITESKKVYRHLTQNHLPMARMALSMIVGRDTECLDEEGVIKGAVETVAENTSDGELAPMLYTALGGPVLGFFYKAVNTMDSMVGYRNEKYCYFGRAAAKLDDFVNYIPARVSAYCMILAAFLAGKPFHGKDALRIYQRDRKKHASPNAGQTESVCAGALGIRLCGAASYGGKIVNKPYIGDDLRKAERNDILLANRLAYVSAWLCEGFCLAMIWLTIHILEALL